MFDSDENRIPGIYNFCDRWCERCNFTDRCEGFAREIAYNLDESLDPVADVLEIVAESLAGVDERPIQSSEEIVELAREYALENRRIVEHPDEWAADPDEDPNIREALEVIRYYLFPIAAKVNSCYAALGDGREDFGEITNSQSYVNGTAKITLILIERSISSWKYLRNDLNDLLIDPIVERLEGIKEKLEEKFPVARDFVRPGFDELETVM